VAEIAKGLCVFHVLLYALLFQLGCSKVLIRLSAGQLIASAGSFLAARWGRGLVAWIPDSRHTRIQVVIEKQSSKCNDVIRSKKPSEAKAIPFPYGCRPKPLASPVPLPNSVVNSAQPYGPATRVTFLCAGVVLESDPHRKRGVRLQRGEWPVNPWWREQSLFGRIAIKRQHPNLTMFVGISRGENVTERCSRLSCGVYPESLKSLWRPLIDGEVRVQIL